MLIQEMECEELKEEVDFDVVAQMFYEEELSLGEALEKLDLLEDEFIERYREYLEDNILFV